MKFQIGTEEDLARALTRPGADNTAKELFGESRPEWAAELTPSQQDLYKEAQGVREKLRQAKQAGADTAGLEQEAATVLGEKWFLKQVEIREQIEAAWAQAEKQYHAAQDPVRDLLALQRLQQRFGVMSEEELEDEIAGYAEDPDTWTPDA